MILKMRRTNYIKKHSFLYNFYFFAILGNPRWTNTNTLTTINKLSLFHPLLRQTLPFLPYFYKVLMETTFFCYSHGTLRNWGKNGRTTPFFNTFRSHQYLHHSPPHHRYFDACMRNPHHTSYHL